MSNLETRSEGGTLSTFNKWDWRDTPESHIAVADAVEAVLATVQVEKPAYIKCPTRAAVTHGVLTALTPFAWQICAGNFHAQFADNIPEPDCVAWNFERGLAEGRGHSEFHAWVVGPRGQIVDGTSRHLPAYADSMGFRWTRPVLPVAWGDAATLRRESHFVYRPNAFVTDMFHRDLLPMVEDAGLDNLIATATGLAVVALSRLDFANEPQSMDVERLSAAEAKRQRKAARRGSVNGASMG
jgi:hypothetical protein